MTDRDNLLTGSLLLRAQEESPPDGTDREVYAVIGVVAVPKGSDWKPEHLIPVISYDGGATMSLLTENQTPLPEGVPAGGTANQLLLWPMWKV